MVCNAGARVLGSAAMPWGKDMVWNGAWEAGGSCIRSRAVVAGAHSLANAITRQLNFTGM